MICDLSGPTSPDAHHRSGDARIAVRLNGFRPDRYSFGRFLEDFLAQDNRLCQSVRASYLVAIIAATVIALRRAN
jgi:hypothetical protein